MQNYWTRMSSGSSKKNGFKSTRWNEDFNLMSWTHLTLFDEYLEMGQFNGSGRFKNLVVIVN